MITFEKILEMFTKFLIPKGKHVKELEMNANIEFGQCMHEILLKLGVLAQ